MPFSSDQISLLCDYLRQQQRVIGLFLETLDNAMTSGDSTATTESAPRMEPTTPGESMESMTPMEPAIPAELTEPAKLMEPTPSTEPAEPVSGEPVAPDVIGAVAPETIVFARPASLTSSDPRQDALLDQLWQHMLAEQLVDPLLIQAVVFDRGYYPADVPIASYDPEFIADVLLAAWPTVSSAAREKINDLPF